MQIKNRNEMSPHRQWEDYNKKRMENNIFFDEDVKLEHIYIVDGNV